jgi:type I restriction enzyme S subunit
VQNFFKKSLKGIGVPNLHLERVRETLLPIPPFNEQKRITYQIEKLLTQVTKISNALK